VGATASRQTVWICRANGRRSQSLMEEGSAPARSSRHRRLRQQVHRARRRRGQPSTPTRWRGAMSPARIDDTDQRDVKAAPPATRAWLAYHYGRRGATETTSSSHLRRGVPLPPQSDVSKRGGKRPQGQVWNFASISVPLSPRPGRPVIAIILIIAQAANDDSWPSSAGDRITPPHVALTALRSD